MRKWIIGCLALSLVIIGCTSDESKQMAQAKSSFTSQQAAAGKVMFDDEGLGTLGRKCSQCHDDLDSIKSFVNSQKTDIEKLQHKIGICYTSALEGPELKPENVTMKNLTAYLLTFKK